MSTRDLAKHQTTNGKYSTKSNSNINSNSNSETNIDTNTNAINNTTTYSYSNNYIFTECDEEFNNHRALTTHMSTHNRHNRVKVESNEN